ncbi:MAG TPA: glycosyltransferase family 4 protein [Candidatus Acidoferrales bacterium]|nr:glycosyltransferase family 4 protein [Candidatus Acidoferrales bacterium]
MTSAGAPARILIVSHSYYEEDPRVRREAEALVAAGLAVDVLGLRKPGSSASGSIDGVRVRRLPVQRHQGAGIGTYLAEYAEFFGRVALAAVPLHARRHYALAQVATLPDPLVFALAPLRLDGVPVVLDLHEAMPEFFRSRFPASRRLVRLSLLTAERASIAFASHVLTVNDALRDRLTALGVPPSKVTVVLNSPRSDRFDPRAHAARAFMADGRLRLVYAGALTPLYQLDVVVAAVARLARGTDGDALDVTLDLYGRGDAEASLRAAAADLGVADRVTFHGRIPVEAVAGEIAAADVGLAPTRRDEFTDFSLSTKIFEYAAMGKPVVASRLPTVARYFGESVCYFEPGDAVSLTAAVRRVAKESAYREMLVAAAADRVRGLSWEREAARYVALIRELGRG